MSNTQKVVNVLSSESPVQVFSLQNREEVEISESVVVAEATHLAYPLVPNSQTAKFCEDNGLFSR